MSRHSLLLAPASLAVAAVIGLGSGGAASAAEACGQPAVPAVYTTVHHDAITATVPGTTTTTWLWTRQVATTDTAYSRVVTPAQGTWSWSRSTPTTERQFSKVVVDQPAQPGVPEQGHSVTTTTVLTWTYVQQTTGKTRCEDSDTWNAGTNGNGWSLVGPCDTTRTTTWVVDVPAVPAVPEVSHVDYVWVAQGDSAPAGYDATGATRPGDPVVETAQSATQPAGDGWVQGAFTQTVAAVTEVVWVAEGDTPPADGTPTGDTRPGTPVTQTSDRAETAPDGDGWTQVPGSDQTTTTPDTTEVVTPAWDEQVLVTPAVPAGPACTDPGDPGDPGPVADPDPGVSDPASADYGQPAPGGVSTEALGTAVSTTHPAVAPAVAAQQRSQPGRAVLPNTGNPVDPWLLALGGSLVLGGTSIVVRQLRRS